MTDEKTLEKGGFRVRNMEETASETPVAKRKLPTDKDKKSDS